MSVEGILREKGIKYSKEELELLEKQWEAIRQLKNDFTNVRLAVSDLGMTHNPGGVYLE